MIKTRDMIILACIAIVTMTLSLSLHTQSESTSKYKITTLLKDSPLHFDDVHSIVLSRDGLQLEFARIDGVWWQESPFQVRMDPFSMRALIESVQGVQVLGEFDSLPSLGTLGLDADVNNTGDINTGVNRIVLSDGITTATVRLGRKTLGGRAYASLDGATPVLIDQSLHRRAVDMDYRVWRDIRLFPGFAIDGTRIEREGNGDRLLLERIDGRWEMREPTLSRVDQDLLIQWVGQLAAAQVGSFVIDQPTDLSLFGLDNPTAFFAVEDRKGASHKLLIGSRVSAGTQDRYVMIAGQPVVFSLRWDIMSQFFPEPKLLVDGTGSGVSRFDTKRITIRSNTSELIIERSLDRWIDQTKGGIPVDREAVNALLAWVLDARPKSVAFGSYPRDLEIGTITFAGFDLVPLDTVRIARDEQGNWILENGDNVLRLHVQEAGDVLKPFIQD